MNDPRKWESFLGRPPLAVDSAAAAASLHGKRILMTGAGGWIGAALTHCIAGFAPSQLVLLEASERNLFELDSALQQTSTHHVSVLGSVADSVLLADIFHRYQPQIVYHAAAFKHVPLMEHNPFCAIENNTLGTNALLAAAANSGAEQLILLSTDKAVDPVSIMGASKRIAELILLASSSESLQCKAVRLGNVLGSEGSIVPLFLKQILAAQPVTVTHRDVRRYFLSIADAVALLLAASYPEAAPGILVPELGEPVRVEALARHLMQGRPPVSLVFTQLRPGDKMCEALLSANESYRDGYAHPLRPVHSPALPSAALDEILQQLQWACRERSLVKLLAAVLRAVPEYRPSALMQVAGTRPA